MKTYRYTTFHFLKKVVCGISMILLIFTISCGKNSKMSSSEENARKVSEYNKPSTVYIEGCFQGTVLLPKPDLSKEAENVVQYYGLLVRSGAMTLGNMLDAFINDLLKNAEEYLVPSREKSQEIETGFYASGSGFIITQDGYIVTNAHVVTTTKEQFLYYVSEYALNEQIQKDADEILDDFRKINVNISNEQVNKMIQAYVIFYRKYMSMSSEPTATINVYLPVSVPGVGVQGKPYQCDIKKMGAPTPGKDIAILKISASNLPTAILSESEVHDGDLSYAMGYPGVVSEQPDLERTAKNILSPTFTSGIISGRKTMSTGGWEVYQTNADINHGNSGGPLLNSNGEVIAINTFGSIEKGSPVLAAGFNFSIPIAIAEEFLKEANVKPEVNELTLLYREAVDLKLDEHYRAALDVFKEVVEINPGFPYAQDQITECNAAISAGKNSPYISTFRAIIYIIVCGMAIIVVVVLVFPKIRKKGLPKLPVKVKLKDVKEAPPEPKSPEPEAPFTSYELEANQEPQEDKVSKKGSRFCSNCGNKVEEGAAYCSSCGAKIV